MASSQLSDVEAESTVTLELSDKTEQLLQGPVTKLSFQLKPNTHLNTFTPTETNEPLVPKGAESGTVLDTVRSLSNATAFNAYIWTTDLPESMLDRIVSIVNNQLLNTQPPPNQFSTLLPVIQGKPISIHNEGQAPPSHDASNQIITHDEPTPNVSSKRRCVSQDRIDHKDLTCDVRRQEAKALVMEIKVYVSAIDDKYKTHNADFLQTREEQEKLVNRLDTIDEKQEEQKKQHEENMRKISEDPRRDVAKGLMQGINWD
ncbi:hypothetical protein QL093DRAFT_2626875 [Fusarium oxysporum]|nr:hypothetical protein QL093DRAFT_2626875 [Fusarium oxysporum]